ncbi:hypothetical protein CDD83_1516 [Cordyceps sp. RAO-2017]|nr:hypothetical protein CDD83_1516 [Cordyceps sp. RAO-2017]
MKLQSILLITLSGFAMAKQASAPQSNQTPADKKHIPPGQCPSHRCSTWRDCIDVGCGNCAWKGPQKGHCKPPGYDENGSENTTTTATTLGPGNMKDVDLSGDDATNEIDGNELGDHEIESNEIADDKVGGKKVGAEQCPGGLCRDDSDCSGHCWCDRGEFGLGRCQD